MNRVLEKLRTAAGLRIFTQGPLHECAMTLRYGTVPIREAWSG